MRSRQNANSPMTVLFWPFYGPPFMADGALLRPRGPIGNSSRCNQAGGGDAREARLIVPTEFDRQPGFASKCVFGHSNINSAEMA
jgi:hypothetical protein